MSIPHIFSTVKPQDFTLTPITVNKKYTITRSQLFNGSMPITGSGYKILTAIYPTEPLKLGTDRTYPTNSFDGSYQHIVWKQLDAMYYRFPYDTAATLEHANPRFTAKNLSYSASIFQIPQGDFGEGIKPASVELTASLGGSIYTFEDDGNGNLVWVSTDGDSLQYAIPFITSSVYQLQNWKEYEYIKKTNFENVITDLTYRQLTGKTYTFTGKLGGYQNSEVQMKDVFHATPIYIVDGYIQRAIPFYFPPNSNSYIRTINRPDLNLTGDFTIRFYFICTANITDFTFIDKSKVKRKIEYDNFANTIDGQLVRTSVSSSDIYEPSSVYPYRFSLDSTGHLVFSRSNGIETITMTSSDQITLWGNFRSVTVRKNGSSIVMDIDGVGDAAVTDFPEPISNDCDVMFGCPDFTTVIPNDSNNSFDVNGMGLAYIQFYDKFLTQSEFEQLDYSGYPYNKVVGNVFYKSGKVVFTDLIPTYTLFSEDFTFKFRNTHTIYQYECLVRIKSGDFNLSLNPTTLKNPHSDLLIDAMTGSMDDGALMPYCTEIGLYNEKAELLVVGKLAQPLKMRDDVNLHIILRFDA